MGESSQPALAGAASGKSSIATGIVWVALLALVVIPTLTVAYESAVHFSGSAIDGPFQLYNALRRINAGYQPGTGFQFFHGVGIPYLYYWLFRLLGGQFVDSEIARQLVSAIVFPASSLLFFRAFTGSWARSACLTVATIALAFLLRFPALLFAINSMTGVRSALPVLFPAFLYVARSRRERIIGGGILLGASLFFSTEQGLALVAAFVLVSLVVTLRAPRRPEELTAAGATLAIAAAVLFLSLTLVGGFRGALGALRYNFVFVPMDQYWFFGAPPNPFVPSWAAGVGMAIEAWTIGLALFLGLVATAFYLVRVWKTSPNVSERDHAFALLAVYGLVSCVSLLGVFVPAYSLACWRVLISLGLLEFLAWADRRGIHRGSREMVGVSRVGVMGTLALLAVTLLLRPTLLRTWFVSVPHVVADHWAGGARFEATRMWMETLAIDSQVVKVHSDAHGPPVVWSTYSGWLEARAGIFNPSYDYIIHALGPERQAYLDRFLKTRPELVQTVSPLYTPYEAWIENANWDFYRALLSSYAVTAETPWSLIWERRADTDSTSIPVGAIELAPGATSVALPAAPTVGHLPVTVVQVEVEYQTRNPLRRLPIIGASPRYLVGITGAISQVPVSLNPYTTVYRFPVIVRPGDKPRLDFKVYSLLPGASISVRRVRVSAVPVDPRSEVWLRNLAVRLTG
jgi:hypothetical protein